MGDLVHRAAAAFVDEEYDEAHMLYSKALQSDSRNADLYAQRAQVLIKLGQFLDAAADASKAIELNPNLVKAYLRKGTALFELEEFESAKKAFEAGAALDPTNNSFKTWIRKCGAELEDEEAEADEQQNGTKDHETSSPITPPQPANSTAQAPAPGDTTPAADPTPAASEVIEPQPQPQAPAPPPPKYRHQWFQTATIVEVAVMAKNLKPEQIDVSIEVPSTPMPPQPNHLPVPKQQRQALQVAVRDTEGKPEYELRLDLYAEVDPAASHWELLRTKAEIRLAKAQANCQWPSLEVSDKVVAANYSAPDAGKLAYPSSFRKKPLDWDKVEAEVKAAEKDEKLEGEQALQKLFQDIYAGADEETRRAMNKSFVESNGTVLSTNWQEVGSKTIRPGDDDDKTK